MNHHFNILPTPLAFIVQVATFIVSVADVLDATGKLLTIIFSTVTFIGWLIINGKKIKTRWKELRKPDKS